VADLPTAFFLVAAEIQHGTIVGQFPSAGEPEQFGMLFSKGNPLVSCVNQALATIKGDGTLAAIEKKWLSDTVNVPILK
jgi:polar amino acid transport system substrate-binding protein